QKRLDVFRVERLRARSETDQVAEHDADHLALAPGRADHGRKSTTVLRQFDPMDDGAGAPEVRAFKAQLPGSLTSTSSTASCRRSNRVQVAERGRLASK